MRIFVFYVFRFGTGLGSRVIDSSFEKKLPETHFDPYLLENQDLLLKIYGQKLPSSRNYGIPTPSAIVRTQLARRFPFDESLSEREDLWFFHTLLKNGAKISQIPDVLLTVNSRKLTGDRNVTLESDLQWFSKL